jgi:hypothetical protein
MPLLLSLLLIAIHLRAAQHHHHALISANGCLTLWKDTQCSTSTKKHQQTTHVNAKP